MSFVCYVVFITLYTSFVDAERYLKINNQTFLASHDTAAMETFSLFHFRAGDHVTFTCHKHSSDGNIMLNIKREDEDVQPFTETKEAEVSQYRQLSAADKGLFVSCVFFSEHFDKVGAIKIKAVTQDTNKKSVVWLIVLGVVLLLVVAAAAAWVWASYRNRRRNTDSLTVAYAERNSVENLDPRSKESNDTHKSKETEANDTSKQNPEVIYPSLHHEPTNNKVNGGEDNAPTYESIVKPQLDPAINIPDTFSNQSTIQMV